MNLRHLRFFVAVTECRGISKAAAKLHVSQPAISAAVRSLENELGHELLERGSGLRSVRLTVQGMRFYDHARDIIDRCDAARRSLSEAGSRIFSVRIGVLRTLAAGDIAAAHAALRQCRPDWRWSFREGSQQEIAKWLSQQRIDIGWTIVDGAADMSSVLWRESYVAMTSRQHRFAQSARLSLSVADLTDELIVLRGACELKPGTLKAAGLNMKAAARAERDDLALRLVASGAGIAIAPQSLATAEVVSLPVDDLELSRSIGFKSRAGVPEHVRNAVADTLRAVAGFRSQA